MVRRGEVSPGEILEAALARVEARNPVINAVVARLGDLGRAAIRAGLVIFGKTSTPELGIATAGPDVGDPYWAPAPAGPFLAEVGRDPGRLRIALTTETFDGQPVDPECARAAVEAGRLCESLGHHVEEARPSVDAGALGEATRVIAGGHVRAQLEGRATALGRALVPEDVERVTWLRAEDGRAFPSASSPPATCC